MGRLRAVAKAGKSIASKAFNSKTTDKIITAGNTVGLGAGTAYQAMSDEYSAKDMASDPFNWGTVALAGSYVAKAIPHPAAQRLSPVLARIGNATFGLGMFKSGAEGMNELRIEKKSKREIGEATKEIAEQGSASKLGVLIAKEASHIKDPKERIRHHLGALSANPEALNSDDQIVDNVRNQIVDISMSSDPDVRANKSYSQLVEDRAFGSKPKKRTLRQMMVNKTPQQSTNSLVPRNFNPFE